MTPKEKAQDLVDRYYWTFGDGYLGLQHIQCASIAVDEMIKISEEAILYKKSKREWLQEVKKEIEKL